MSDFFSTSIEYLKGVGPKRAELFKEELGIGSFADLLTYYPFRYQDRSKFYQVKEIQKDLPYVQLKGQIISIDTIGQKRQRRLVAIFSDGTGTIELVWFKGVKWLQESLKLATPYLLFGKPSSYRGKLNIVHPELETLQSASAKKKGDLIGVYSTSEKCRTRGLDSKGIFKIQMALQEKLPPKFEETLPDYISDSLRLIGRRAAFKQIHSPDSVELLEKAQFRLKFEELFYLQIKLARKKQIRISKYKGLVFENIGEAFNGVYENLPFELTNAQKRVLKEIRSDCKTGKQMNRLLQGDVGSGKTMVALLCMLMAVDNGFQACIMAPTEILAQQHIMAFEKFLTGSDLKFALLTGSTKSAERNQILEDLQEGKLNLLIGTHALLEDRVKFYDLGMVIIDEQHRFGVEQRSKLWRKSEGTLPHVLVMTATPIPRTLAMTAYGDLDVSVIDELPPGRKPVLTKHMRESEKNRFRVMNFLKKEIASGRQVYIVYPLIEESEKLDYLNLIQGFEAIQRDFPIPEYQVSVVHGQMKPEDKEFEMQRFKDGKTNIMVATTVIEVGVDIPNATVMVIESAERFGLSQLHQLRGRVGRGSESSYCILITKKEISKEAIERMSTMVRTNDGFEVAEVDLRLRGPGDIEGTRQSGELDLKISDLIKDTQILELARNLALQIIKDDPQLILSKNLIINDQLRRMKKGNVNWSVIS